DAGPLDAAECRSRRNRLGVGKRRAKPEQTRQVILERRLVVLLLAELAAETGDEARGQLAGNRQLGPRSELARRLDGKSLQAQLALDGLQERIGQKSGGQRAGADRELLLLRGGEAVRRRVED